MSKPTAKTAPAKARKPAASSSSATKARPAASKARTARSKPTNMTTGISRSGEKVVLLSGGNPQIAKGDGDGPVQKYIDAMPGWKHDLGKRLDALIVRSVPRVQKAVRWNTPFYGVEGKGWFLGFHVFARYVKVTFFRGTSLRPVPPGASKDAETRYYDIHEAELDEARMVSWVKQAAALPGWIP